MDQWPWWAVALLLLGHCTLWFGMFNRLHVLRLPCRFVRLLEGAIAGGTIAGLLLLCRALAPGPAGTGNLTTHPFLAAYGLAGTMALILASCRCLHGRLHPGVAAWVGPVGRRRLAWDLPPSVGGKKLPAVAALPGNQAFRGLEVCRKEVWHPAIPSALDGMCIAHVSDLHFCRHVPQAVIGRWIEAIAQCAPDAIALSGDIVDHDECLPWVAETLGQLSAPAGRFFVLGNHDRRLRDPGTLRSTLTRCGWTDVGGRCLRVDWRGVTVLWIGNEWPWFPAPADQLIAGPWSTDPDLRICLAHTPDVLPWAVRHRVDLLLAGHTHGGQVRLPVVGALVCPSLYGVAYQEGFYRRAGTLLHVTRGLGSLQPLRLGCPPEVSLLILRSRNARHAGPKDRL